MESMRIRTTVVRDRTAPLILLLACLALVPTGLAGQGTYGVAGVVRDGLSNAPVSDVRISLDEVTREAITDQAGRFHIQGLTAGVYTLRASRLGYDEYTLEGLRVGPGIVLELSLALTPRALDLAELVVSPGTFSYMGRTPSVSQTMSRVEIESVPQFGEDIFRAVNRLPGLTSGDYAAQFSIRGGRPDQNLILLDGLEIYEPYHLKDYADGAFSIIDVETIGGVELMTGGFPARYGNRSSGVFSMTSREPEPGVARYSLGASLLNARAMAEGTFDDGRGSWLVSARRGYLDLIVDLLKSIDLPSPSYFDAFGKVRYDLSADHSLTFEFLHGRDHYRFDADGTTGFQDSIRTKELANNRYGNSYVWTSLRSLLGERVVVNTMLSAGLVTSTRDGSENYVDGPGFLYTITNKRDFHVYGFKQDWRADVAEPLSLRWGIDARRLDADYAVTNTVGQNPDDPSDDTLSYYPHETSTSLKRDGNLLGTYGSVRVAPVDPVAVEVGLRYDRGSYTDDSDLSPRVNALIRLPGRNSLRAGWGIFRQIEGIADVEALEGPGAYLPSERSNQWTVGLEHLTDAGGTFRVEAYHRSGSRQRPVFRNFRGGLDVFPETSEDWILVHPDSLRSRGVEIYFREQLRENLAVTASYALAEVREWSRSIDNVNVPEPLDFYVEHGAPHDQRHAVNLDVAYRLSGAWTLNASYAFHSGWPGTTEHLESFTDDQGRPDFAVRPDTLYAHRFPAYQRLDVRVTKRVIKGRGDLRLFFEVTNLTNHENVFGYDYFRAPGPNGTLRLERDTETGFIIMPSLGVSWRGPF